VGTGGGNEVQITVFSSGTGSHYRRAIGTFREPGLLAEWLLLPLFLSFAARNRFARFGRAAMAVSLLLTVSMTGILSAGFGAAAAYLLTNPFRKRHMKQLATAVVVVLVLGLLAQMAAVGIGGTSENILSILSVRVGQLSEAGVAGTDRSYVYEFLRDHPPPALGYGLGNSNLYATHETGVYALFSFLSLYVNILYSAGVVGLALLLMFLLPPVLRGALRSLRGSLGATTFILMAYLAYLAAYGATSEELSVPFAIAAALLRYATARRAAEQAAAAAPVPVPVPPPPPHPGKRPLHAEPRRN
jgi:hypothetical protein